MSWLRRRNIADPPSEAPEEPKEPRHYRVQPRFILLGPVDATDDEGYIVVDLTWVPSGVTEIQLQSGNLFVTYPFDIDGHRVRNPEAKSVKLRWTME